MPWYGNTQERLEIGLVVQRRKSAAKRLSCASGRQVSNTGCSNVTLVIGYGASVSLVGNGMIFADTTEILLQYLTTILGRNGRK